jgi:hypothetical protein
MLKSRPFGSLLLLVSILIAPACGQSSPPAEESPPDSGETAAPTATVPPVEEVAEPETAPPPTTIKDVSVSVEPIETPGLDVVRAYTEQFYAGELQELHAKFSEEMQQSFPLGQLKALHDQVRSQYGKEIEVIGEEGQTRGEYRGFARWARFDKYDGVIEVQWILREDDSIAGLFVQPTKPRQP